MQDANKFAATIIGLNPPLTYSGAKVFNSFAIQLALFVKLIPDIIQVFLQYPDKFQGQLERLLIEIKTIRLDVWFLKTIFENTPNLPWDKLGKYLSSHKPIPIDTHIEDQEDLANFTYLISFVF